MYNKMEQQILNIEEKMIKNKEVLINMIKNNTYMNENYDELLEEQKQLNKERISLIRSLQ